MIKFPLAMLLTLSGVLAQAAASTPQQKVVIPGKGTLVRWVFDPAIPAPRSPLGHATGDLDALAAPDEVACIDGDFRSTPFDGQPGAVLVSRHKYCQQYESSPTTISVDLMRRTGASPWEYYRPGISAFETRTFDVGTLSLRTRMHAYGASGILRKTHKIDISATSFSFAPDFPANLRAGVFVTLQPDGGASLPSNSGIQNFTIGVSAINPVTLSAATPAGSTGAFDVSFNWTYAGADPLGNLVQFAVFAPRYAYTVNNTPRVGTTEAFYIGADSSASWLFQQVLRCDKGVATGASEPAEGCIFEQAAPVFKISATGDAAEEALHVFQAQTTTDAYKTEKSPGVFVTVPGTRVVADETQGARYMGLLRGSEPDAELNRTAACDAQNSLIKLRPYSGSASCPTAASPDCSGDEYPYAITRNGAAYNPAATSVRRINANQNYRAGGLLQGMFRSERVIPGEKFWVQVTDIH